MTGTRGRDTPAGRAVIAEQLARLRLWCQEHEVPWVPASPAPEPVEADHGG